MQTEVNHSDFTHRFTFIGILKHKPIYALLSVKLDGLPSLNLRKLILQNKPNGRSHSPHPRLLAMVGFPASIL
jgi:hypothetical protein